MLRSLTFIVLLTMGSTSFGQMSYLKAAESALNTYYRSNSILDLEAAKSNADEACYNSASKEIFKAWEVRAEVYEAIFKNEEMAKRYDKYDVIDIRYKSLKKAWKLIPDKSSVRSVELYKQIFGLGMISYDRGQNEYDREEFSKAYDYFATTVNFNNFLKDNGEEKEMWMEGNRDTAMLLGGESAYKCGRYEDAVPFLEEAIKLSKTPPKYYGYLLESYKATCQLDKAEKFRKSAGYRLASIRAKEDVEFQYNLARALQLEGHLEQAMESFNHILEIDPDHYGANYNKAMIIYQEAKTLERERARIFAIEGKNAAKYIRDDRNAKLKEALAIFNDLLFHDFADVGNLKRLYDEAITLKLK